MLLEARERRPNRQDAGASPKSTAQICNRWDDVKKRRPEGPSVVRKAGALRPVRPHKS